MLAPRVRRLLPVVVAVVLAGCGTVTAGHGSAVRQTPSSASSSVPSSSAPSSSVPSSSVPSSSVPTASATPTVKGWRAVSTQYGIAYDVPPDWKVSSSGVIQGWENDDGIILTVHNTAELDPGFCPNDNYSSQRGLTGATRGASSPTETLKAALSLVPKIFSDDDGSHRPTVTSTSSSRTVSGTQIATAVAKVSGVHTHSSCGAAAAVFYIVALTPPGGSPVAWIGTLDQGNSGAEPATTMAKIAATVRVV